MLVWGGANYGLYTAGLALIGDRFRAEMLTAATAALASVYALAAIIGPVVAGGMMTALGAQGLFGAAAVVYLTALCGGLWLFRLAEASNPLMSAMGSIVPFAMHVEDNYNLLGFDCGRLLRVSRLGARTSGKGPGREICQIQVVFNVRADRAACGLGPRPNPALLRWLPGPAPDLPRSTPEGVR
ncbi:MFS transporter [Mesorhizobium sp.]|uniref:MFS transporter n=1 Tax=Mesorhizobium sp. TaxID=1871066 RepID=UPI0025F72ECE|nr:MFS transporter [Mesorhizobium sp.]